MKASVQALSIIKNFEGLQLKSYKPVQSEKKYTIGYGHYGVKSGLTISIKEAEDFLLLDVKQAEKHVNKYDKIYHFTQNQYDALVSFAFNLGKLDQLTNFGTRTIDEIAEAIPKYNKAGGVVLSGLVKRRRVERMVFLSPKSTTMKLAS